MHLGEYFRKHRETLGLTQKEVANKMGISINQHISNVERGANCAPDFAIRMCKALDLDLQDVCRIYIKDKVESIKKEFGV
jgi:transcriptional regulator with XRE-family HTH domain